jgi:hypothetical protein
MISAEPLAGNLGANLRVVLVIRGNDFNFHAVRSWVEVLHRQLGRGYRAWPGVIGIRARHIGEDAELNGNLISLRGRANQRGCSENETGYQSHCTPALSARIGS